MDIDKKDNNIKSPYINFSIEGIKRFAKLSKGAQLLLIEMFETVKDSNKFVTNTDKIKEIIHTKRSDEVYKVIKELKDADFLYKGGKENKDTVYVINHNLWFRGNYNKFMNKLLIIYTDVIPDSNKKLVTKNSADDNEYMIGIDEDWEIN